MNLIDKVTEMKANATKKHGVGAACDNVGTTNIALQNVAPVVLDILGEIRHGDADLIEEILYCGILWNEYQSEVLRRYQAMAAKMEENK